jgi:hypothetical protein
MLSLRPTLLAAASLILVASLLAQDVAETSAVTGVVFDATTNKPLAGVRIYGPPRIALPPAPANKVIPAGDFQKVLDSRVETTTDADGKFAIENLGTGLIELQVLKAGYMGHPVRYSLTAGQRVSEAVVLLEPLRVIAGRVAHNSGRPAVNVSVSAYVFDLQSIGKELIIASSARTSDRGEFRLINLPPGEYVVGYRTPSTLYPGVGSVENAERVKVDGRYDVVLNDVVLGSSGFGAIRIHIRNTIPEPSKDILYWFTNLTTSREYGGDGSLMTGIPMRPPVGMKPCGDDRIPPCTTQLSLMHVAGGADSEKVYTPDTPGTFEFGARWTAPDGSPNETIVPIHFTGADMDVEVALTPAKGELAAAVLIEGPASVAPESKSIQIKLCNLQLSPCYQTGFTRFAPDGSVVLKGFAAGRYAALVELPSGFYLSSMKQQSRDVMADGVVVSDDSTPLEIRVRAGGGTLSGRVTSADGRPVHNALVALDPEQRIHDALVVRFRPMRRTDQNGRFEFTDVRPGTYRAFAWNFVSTVFLESSLIERFRDRGTLVSIDDNGTALVDLKVLN